MTVISSLGALLAIGLLVGLIVVAVDKAEEVNCDATSTVGVMTTTLGVVTTTESAETTSTDEPTTTTDEPEAEVCTTSTCILESSQLFRHMNLEANP